MYIVVRVKDGDVVRSVAQYLARLSQLFVALKRHFGRAYSTNFIYSAGASNALQHCLMRIAEIDRTSYVTGQSSVRPPHHRDSRQDDLRKHGCDYCQLRTRAGCPINMLIHSVRLTCAFKRFPSHIVPLRFLKHQSIIRMASTLPKLPVFEAIAGHDPNSTAVIHCKSGRRFTYGQLLNDVADARDKLRQSAAGHSTDGQRIAFLVENSYDYVGATEVKTWDV